MTDAPPGVIDVFLAFLRYCSWVNIIMIGAALGMLFLGKMDDRIMFSGIALIVVALFLGQGNGRVFAGGLVSSFVGLAEQVC